MISDLDEVQWAYLLEPTFQVLNTAGKPLTDGYIEVYIHGTRNKYYCAKDFDGTLHEFKIPLDSLGSNIVLASPAHAYDVYVYNKFGSLVMSRYNVVPATGDGAVIKDVVTIASKDGTVDVTTSNQTDWDLSIKDTVDRVQHNEQEIGQIKEDVANTKTDLTNLTEVVNNHTTEIGQIKEDVNTLKEDVAGIESSLTNKKDKQPPKNFNGSATKTVKNITQNANGELTVEFADIDLPQEVPNVEITSADNSIQVTETTDVQTNTKKFDLSVKVDDPLEYGQFRATNVTSQAFLNKVQGNLDLNNYSIKLKKGNSYHFTVRGSYVANSAVNTSTTIHYIEYSSFTPIQVNVDNTITDAQFFEISYDVYKLSSDKNYNVAFSSITGGKVSELWVEVHNLNGISVNGQGGGSGDNDKVAIDANAVPGYLEDVLVSDSDIVTLVKFGNKLHVQVNTASTADPKLATCDEAVINGATNNYGSYALANGYDKLIWNDPSSYSWLNANVIQMKRLCTSQGTVTKCNLALCGTLSLTTPPAFINCCIFNTNGTILGSTGLRLYGTDFFSGSELVSFDMSEAIEGALKLKNNTYYIIQIVTCGLQLASLSHADSYNYTYDYDLRMNLQGATSELNWKDINALTERASQIPWISFAASPNV